MVRPPVRRQESPGRALPVPRPARAPAVSAARGINYRPAHPAGRERSQQAVTKHGRYARARREERRQTRVLLREWRRLRAALT